MMRRTARFLLAFAVALLLMLCFRTWAFTICTVDGEGLAPMFQSGDRVLVNRWTYGLRIGKPLGYGRIGKCQVQRGDLVAFYHPEQHDKVLICQCKAVPGDTIFHDDKLLIVPGRITCAAADHYWMESIGQQNMIDSHLLGFISEELIIGRATTIIYSHNTREPFWRGWDSSRFLMPL